MEAIGADLLEEWIDMARDVRDAWYEMSFYALWGGPFMRAFGVPNTIGRAKQRPGELRSLPEVQMALRHIATGGFADALVRMLVLLADSRGVVRRDRLERASWVITRDAPLSALDMAERARIINEQTLIATFAPQEAIATLPDLLPTEAERRLAVETAQYIAGPSAEMSDETRAALASFRNVLGLEPTWNDITADPLAGDRPAIVEGAMTSAS